jgi:hypothetical protein
MMKQIECFGHATIDFSGTLDPHSAPSSISGFGVWCIFADSDSIKAGKVLGREMVSRFVLIQPDEALEEREESIQSWSHVFGLRYAHSPSM